ncbi:MAG: ribonuclease D [Cyanosarcina radialis HA8281-LM2]|jgi:ribonuclease D|nr:ribonuclease D [Cyanosarcina radialis HA8281-LM2]
MMYFTDAEDIQELIASYAQMPRLWVDTEVADYQTRKPRLSLIQVLHHPEDLTGDRVAIFDVLDRPELVADFIDSIMANSAIEKVFHNANYDLKFLGKPAAQNVTCTWEMAKKIPYYLLPLPNLQLKTLAEKLCLFSSVSKAEQTSDWGQRPLTDRQLYYAKMDPVYVAQVHQQLLQITELNHIDPAKEDLNLLTQRYREIADRWQMLNTEMEHLQERIKKAMQAQDISENDTFELSSYQKSSKKVPFHELAKLAQLQAIELDFSVTLTQKLQKELADIIEQLPIQEETTTNWQLKVKNREE